MRIAEKMKQWVKDYFFFSRKDRIAILILVFLIVITLLLPPLFKKQEKISPIANIAIEQQPEIKSDSAPKPLRTKYPVKQFKKKITVININEADTALFIALPGIGSKLAARIIAFRNKLGGFYSVEQIGEVYGLQDSVFQKIKPMLKCNSNDIKKININTITLDELKTHPYIRYYIANNIIAYRDQHGPFQNKEEIKKVVTVTDEVYVKIYPYLE